VKTLLPKFHITTNSSSSSSNNTDRRMVHGRVGKPHGNQGSRTSGYVEEVKNIEAPYLGDAEGNIMASKLINSSFRGGQTNTNAPIPDDSGSRSLTTDRHHLGAWETMTKQIMASAGADTVSGVIWAVNDETHRRRALETSGIQEMRQDFHLFRPKLPPEEAAASTEFEEGWER
jgi:hypothetical protein